MLVVVFIDFEEDKMKTAMISISLFASYGAAVSESADGGNWASSAEKHGWIPHFENLVAFGDR